MVTHTQNLSSAFNPSKVNTQTVNTHPEQCAAIYAAAPGEQLGVRCLAQGSHLSRGIESAVHSLPLSTIPARPRSRVEIIIECNPDYLSLIIFLLCPNMTQCFIFCDLKIFICGSVVDHCVSSAKGHGFNSQGTQYWQKMYNLNAL